jgi:hypothetical protein
MLAAQKENKFKKTNSLCSITCIKSFNQPQANKPCSPVIATTILSVYKKKIQENIVNPCCCELHFWQEGHTHVSRNTAMIK